MRYLEVAPGIFRKVTNMSKEEYFDAKEKAKKKQQTYAAYDSHCRGIAKSYLQSPKKYSCCQKETYDAYYEDNNTFLFKYQGRQYSDNIFDEMFCE